MIHLEEAKAQQGRLIHDLKNKQLGMHIARLIGNHSAYKRLRKEYRRIYQKLVGGNQGQLTRAFPSGSGDDGQRGRDTSR